MLSEIFKLFWKTVDRKDARRINSQTPPTEIEPVSYTHLEQLGEVLKTLTAREEKVLRLVMMRFEQTLKNEITSIHIEKLPRDVYKRQII